METFESPLNKYKLISGKLKHITEEILRHCLGNDLSLFTLTGSSYIQREFSDVHQPVQKVKLFFNRTLMGKLDVWAEGVGGGVGRCSN